MRLEPRPAASAARHAIEAYFEGALTAIDTLPVKTGGTAFQRASGRRCAPSLPARPRPTDAWPPDWPAKGGAGRGMANGANPISIIVPCHRVIGADATLTGYGGGLERKRWLLQHEGVDC